MTLTFFPLTRLWFIEGSVLLFFFGGFAVWLGATRARECPPPPPRFLLRSFSFSRACGVGDNIRDV